MINGKPNGYWITYYPNELRKSEGNRKDFLLDSVWKFYRENGNVKSIFTYKEDERHGKSYYYKNCQVVKEENYNKGELEGRQFTYYETADSTVLLKTSTLYVEGKKEGYAYEYARDGRIITIIDYNKGFLSNREKINRKDEAGRKQGVWKSYYGNERLKKEERYKDDLLNGYVKLYSPEGKLESASLYIDGVKQSEEENQADFNIQNTYYGDGSLRSQITYNLAGKKDGIAKTFKKNGEVEKTEIYRNGYLLSSGIIDNAGLYQGLWETYYLNGQLKSKGEYLDGKKYGKWSYYFQNGTLEQEGFYDKNGEFTGTWKWYYDDSKLLRTEEFRRGLEDGILEEYDRKGNLITKGEFFDGEKEGEWFYELNDHREEGKYRYGERNGQWIHYYPNGDISFEGAYVEGVPEGKHKYYYPNGVLEKVEQYSFGEKDGKWLWYNKDGFETMSITYKNGKAKKIDGSRLKISDI
ncbi:MAG: hypothetical protein RIC95_01205 [Vicingaceae bacterium]